MKKPTLETILERITLEHEMHPDYWVPEGSCDRNRTFAEENPPCEAWLTESPSVYGKFGHFLAVFPLRGANEGLVIDFTSASLVLGIVGLSRLEDTKRELGELIGVTGWKRRELK